MSNPFARLFPGLTGRKGVIESVVARRTFRDVILPPNTLRMLQEALTQVHSYNLIFHEWGLGERHPTGTALAFNFAGPSGTGKTICAEAIAHQLNKRLLLVRYAELESMWFGETPKNVAAIFRMAQEEDAVLFFDEADAIAARRSTDVSHGMQRESNTTINVLLQELERFDGVVIFATNLAANFDPAFERRIRTHVLFELPAVEEREQIWRVQLHQRTPLADDVDFRALAERYAVSGGDIRNAVLKAALAAAAEQGPDDAKRIHQRHFIGAMEDVVHAKAVMKQSVIEAPERPYEAALTETRQMLEQMRIAGTLTAAAAGAALLLAVAALVIALW
ncbi:MAG TPA: ATP-binding protein [Longimicrobiales bacterium]|nr:ATP-binding protein [Longimicrobiales bacterium]